MITEGLTTRKNIIIFRCFQTAPTGEHGALEWRAKTVPAPLWRALHHTGRLLLQYEGFSPHGPVQVFKRGLHEKWEIYHSRIRARREILPPAHDPPVSPLWHHSKNRLWAWSSVFIHWWPNQGPVYYQVTKGRFVRIGFEILSFGITNHDRNFRFGIFTFLSTTSIWYSFTNWSEIIYSLRF